MAKNNGSRRSGYPFGSVRARRRAYRGDKLREADAELELDDDDDDRPSGESEIGGRDFKYTVGR